MTGERKIGLICLGLAVTLLGILGVVESPATAASTGVGLLIVSIVGLAIGRLTDAARRKMTGRSDPSPSRTHSNAWFVSVGFIVGSVLAAGSVCLSLASGAGRNDVPEIIAAAIPLIIVMPFAFWAIGWLANRNTPRH
jgi:hypothetical protein